MFVYMNRTTANITLKYMIYVPESILLHSVRENAQCLVHRVGACGSGPGVKMASHTPAQNVRVKNEWISYFHDVLYVTAVLLYLTTIHR
jgi:hypothetical protein